jgi:hypothetical protein
MKSSRILDLLARACSPGSVGDRAAAPRPERDAARRTPIARTTGEAARPQRAGSFAQARPADGTSRLPARRRARFVERTHKILANLRTVEAFGDASVPPLPLAVGATTASRARGRDAPTMLGRAIGLMGGTVPHGASETEAPERTHKILALTVPSAARARSPWSRRVRAARRVTHLARLLDAMASRCSIARVHAHRIVIGAAGLGCRRAGLAESTPAKTRDEVRADRGRRVEERDLRRKRRKGSTCRNHDGTDRSSATTFEKLKNSSPKTHAFWVMSF